MTLSLHSRRRLALLVSLLSLGGIALAAHWAGGGSSVDAPPGHFSGGDADSAPVPVVIVELTTPGSTVEVGLRRVGIRPESLAAAGVSSPGLATLLQASDGWFITNASLLTEADALYGAARVARDELQRIVRSGLASDQQVIDLQQAESEFQDAASNRASVLGQLFQAATAELSAQQIAVLSQIRANDSWKFPVHFLVEAREQATWVALRNALANERIAPQFGDEPDPGAQALLSELEGREAVVQASANVGTYLASLGASWSASLH